MDERNAVVAEDAALCKHEWVDLYGGAGTDRYRVNTALAAFFCKWCLEIRVKAWSQVRYRLNQELEAERED
jgi:hypothetical protein